MAHRSNQAVASQERNRDPPEDELPPPRRRLLIGWGTALAALAVSTAALAAVIWFARFPIAQFILSSALAERGVEADFRLSTLDFGQAVLNDVRVGSAEAPDASVTRVEANWDWNGLAPALRSVRFVEPHLHLRLDNGGHVSAGALDHVGGSPSGHRAQIPHLDVTIERGVLQIDAPFGPLDRRTCARKERSARISPRRRGCAKPRVRAAVTRCRAARATVGHLARRIRLRFG